MKILPIKKTITIEDLDKLDIRIGTIESVEDIAESNNLMKIQADFGDHKRQIIAGIKKERENPKNITGKQALFVVNLEPRKIMGYLSDGMLFDIGYANKITPVLAIPESKVENGASAG